LVCEPVLAAAMYLLARHSRAQDALFELLQNGALSVAFQINENVRELRKLLQKYRDTPMSLADACIVRMTEVHDRHVVLTLDSDFLGYRKHGNLAGDHSPDGALTLAVFRSYRSQRLRRG